jgi:tetrahydromethanopterin S-methyltransferase subunit G
MTEAAENLVLEHPRAIRSDLGELKRRVPNIETEFVQQGRMLALLVDGQSPTRGRMAEIEVRLDRVERRLELAPLNE